LFSRLKGQTQQFAQKPFATLALFTISFLESSLFPIAPDFFFVPLSLMRPKRAYWYATVCVLGSVGGALLGYYIGYELYEAIGERLVSAFGWTEMFDTILGKYKENVWGTLLLAGFMPIPFQVFTFAAGFNGAIPVLTFMLAALAGRMLRFYCVGTLLFVFGQRIRDLLDKYLALVSLALAIFVLLWILAARPFF
jgi:membrane protein YqaA with SNARE-associated domain